MQWMRTQKNNMILTEKNLREKDFHNELQSRPKGRFENIFYKSIANIWDDFYDDGYVPEGEVTETFIYVEDGGIPVNKKKEYLEILLTQAGFKSKIYLIGVGAFAVCSEIILKYIKFIKVLILYLNTEVSELSLMLTQYST